MIGNIIFRCDASPHIGLGHLMRCLSLAEELTRRNNQCYFLSKTTEKTLIQKILKTKSTYLHLALDLNICNDAKKIIELSAEKKINWTVIDHYDIDSDYLKSLKTKKLQILSIDDTAEIYYPSDIVVNQNIGAKKLNFSADKNTRLLLGPKYVLMRDEILKREKKINNNKVKKILITLGGTDKDNFILTILKTLSHIDENIEYLVLLGHFNPFYACLKKYSKKTKQKIHLIKKPENIADVYLESDIAISAGGSTCYELAYYGIPNIIITIADNQLNIAKELDKKNVSIYIGRKEDFSSKKLSENILKLINDNSLRRKMRTNGMNLVDGKGKKRIVEFMNTLYNEGWNFIKKIRIADRLIGYDEPSFIIAEAGANFRISEDAKKNFRHALKLIDAAVDAEADAVKFQLYRAEKLYVKKAGYADYIGQKKSIYEIIQDMEVPYDWIPKLKQYCDKKNIIFLCTPFDEESADELEKANIQAYKIASYSISHLPLIKHIAKKGKPIILSTGAASIKDIEKAVSTIKKTGNEKISLMQCTAKYPAPLNTINLKVIPNLIKKFDVPVGLSDHSREPTIAPMGAVALGAKILEKHFTTDNNLPGPDHRFAILPDELKLLVRNIRKLEEALGEESKFVQSEEKELFKFCRRKIYAIRGIEPGETLNRNNIAILRSGKQKKGFDPKYFENILGKKASKNIKKGEPIDEESISRN